jgi:hypothetical protein
MALDAKDGLIFREYYFVLCGVSVMFPLHRDDTGIAGQVGQMKSRRAFTGTGSRRTGPR